MLENRTILKLVITTLVFQFFALTMLTSQSAATWSYPISHKNFDYYQNEWGNIVINEKGVITSLKPLTGDLIWKLETGSEKVKLKPVAETPLIIVTGDKLQLVNVLTGEVYVEDTGEKFSYRDYDTFFSKNKMLIDYRKNEKDMVAIVDLKDYSKSVISEMKTKGSIFSGNLRLPSDNGTVFKNKKILNCLSNTGETTIYDSDEKSLNILGGTQSGIATVVTKYKNYKGIDMSTCEIVWEHKVDKQCINYVNERNNVLILSRRKSFDAIDMLTGKILYSYNPDEVLGTQPFFIDGYMYYPLGSSMKKFDARSGELVLEKKFNSLIKSIRLIEDEFYIVTSKNMNKVNLETLKTKFDTGISGSNIVWQEQSDNYSYYITAAADKFMIYCYEDDMTKLWSNKIDGTVFKDAFIIDAGLVVATEKTFKLLQNLDGEKMWSYKSKFNFAAAPNKDNSRYYGIVSGYSFYIDGLSGEFTALPKFKLKDFNTAEAQSNIMVHEDTYIMKSGNNFYIRGLEGEEIVTKHYKAHSNASKWAKIGSAALQVGAVASGNAAEVVKVTDGTGATLHQGSLYNSGSYGRI